MKTMITDIERFSTEDGPGIRTVIILKGCPLHCAWCHNPECISYEKEELFYPEKCIGCGQCENGCYSGARVSCGREMTPEEIRQAIIADKIYYGKEGGITISGGEPLSHPDFVKRIISLCKEESISVGMETTLYRFDKEILSQLDILMADLKMMDSKKHKEYTGIGNEKILENLLSADALNIPIIVRTPIIPGVNDTVKNIQETAEFLRKCRNVIKYELLPYHPLGVSKAKALGREQIRFRIPDKEKMEELNQYADLQR